MTDALTSTTAAERWADALAGWAIPQEVLDAAPDRTPWRFSPAIFAWTPERSAAERPVLTASRRRALEALAEGGTVLDVGAGGGRASLPLAPPATMVVAVDSSAELLDAFGEAATREGVPHRTVFGAWPDVAGEVDVHDVVVCHNVFYNVADLPPFALALTDHARRRVVVELTVDHPTANLNPLWLALHGIERPTAPTAHDAVAVLQEAGLAVEWERSERPLTPSGRSRQDIVAQVRQRLCLGPERDPEIDRLLGPDFDSALRQVVTVWWDGGAGSS